MKEKQYDPARNNEKSPAKGMAAVNTHNPEEEPIEKVIADQKAEDKDQKRDEKADS